MKPNPKKFLLNHSQAKVKLLGEYLKRYLGVISNLGYNERIKIYDLFCGEGLYENGGKGSPLVIMDTIADFAASGIVKSRVLSIDCHFNDVVRAKVEKVEQIIKSEPKYQHYCGELKFTHNDYQNEVRSIINQLQKKKNQKTFIFIDPYGYKDINAIDLRDLLAHKNTEVLLFLPTQFMYRFDEKGTPLSLINLIDELVEYKNWRPTDSVWNFIDQLKKGFRTYLSEYFVDTFTIQKDSNTVFCLFFFSSHIRGFEKMLEAKWEIDEETGKGWEYTGQQPSLFADLKTNPLAELLREILKTERSNSELYQLTLHAGFLPKHTNEILRDWQQAEQLQVISANNKKSRKNAFYISYEHHFNNPNKVKLKII